MYIGARPVVVFVIGVLLSTWGYSANLLEKPLAIWLQAMSFGLK